jgi:serine/threonine protein phosphatase 1
MGKVYCSADWHGNGKLAKQVLDFLQPDDTLIFIGDAIDRDKDGYEIMTRLLSDKRVIYLKGNHEDMMVDFVTHYLDGFHNTFLWFGNGGNYTWYKMETLSDECLKGLVKKVASLPTEYTYISPKGHKVILEHAGHTPFDTPHRSHNPLWDREHFYDNWDGGYGYEDKSEVETTYLVHGHTPVQYLEFRYGYKDQPQKTKEMIEYGIQWNNYYDCDWIPEVIRYCDGHKFCVDMCTVASGRIALLDLDTFETIYFDDKEIQKGVI